jgi:rhodanese-related sulfurtransferase
VVDVRYPRDYEAGHIPGAVLIPLELLSAYLPELSTVNKPIVTYCH